MYTEMKLSSYILCLLIGIVAATYPFQDPTKPWDERVDDLVNRLTLDELAGQAIADYGKPGTPAIERLGIKPYVWITECVHGQVSANTTGFPHSIGLSASWSPELVYNMTTAVSHEVRAQWNNNVAHGTYHTMYGLSCFSPVINIARHPLWGRNQETYGEDPYLSGRMSAAFVTGVHGTHPRYMRVTAGCKHFDVYGGPENIPVSRFNFDSKETYGECPFLSGSFSHAFVTGVHGTHDRYMRVTAGCKHFDVHAGPEDIPVSRSNFNAQVSTRDWRMTFLPAFKMCVDAGTYSLMCSYNRINGVPACANTKLLTNITRGEWGFKGYIVSDAGAVSNIKSQHHYTTNDIDTATVAIKAGTNLELGSRIYDNIPAAVKAGNLTVDEIREQVKPLFYTRMRLGEFDPVEMNPYNDINMSEVQSQEHRDLAIKAASMTFTLLKNQDRLLPLKHKYNQLALVGPMADNIEQMYGDYGSNVLKQFARTPKEALAALAHNMTYAAGCDKSDTHCTKYDSGSVEEAVSGSDLVIVCLGTGQAVEAEGHDRSTLDLPGSQLDLLKDAVYYAQGAPVIVLLFNAGPLDVTWPKWCPEVTAMMACFFPAQSVGWALYNTLTGASVDALPAGRLSMTWPASMEQVPEMTNYTMEGRTYRYFQGSPLYPFGYGLSYTHFVYTGLSVTPKVIDPTTQGVTVKVMVMNEGPMPSDEVTQVYMSWSNTSVPVPKLQLVGFKRHRVQDGETAMLQFTITSEQMRVWMDDNTGWGFLTGTMTVYAGGQQPHQRDNVGSNVLADTFTVKM